MLLVEFTVEGPPVSQQAGNRPALLAWKARVRHAAFQRWPSGRFPVDTYGLRMIVAYFHDGPTFRMDNDNMVKPIQDALQGLVYVNDVQVTDTIVQKRDLSRNIVARGLPIVLGNAFHNDREFLYIGVDEPPFPAGLPLWLS